VALILKDEASRAYNAGMTDQPDKPTPPAPPARTLFGTQLILPPNCRDVTHERSGTMIAFVGATSAAAAVVSADAAADPAPSPAPPERK
jgi:hypothetical protein